jgi:hypothetical protein
MNRMLEESWFDSWEGREIFLFSEESRVGLEPTQRVIQWVLEDRSPTVK